MTETGDLIHVRTIDDFEDPKSQELQNELLSSAEALLQFIRLLGRHELFAVTITELEPRMDGLLCLTVAAAHDDMQKFLAGITCKAVIFTGDDQAMRPVLDAARWFVSATGNAVQEVLELMREHQPATMCHDAASSPSALRKPPHQGRIGLVVAE